MKLVLALAALLVSQTGVARADYMCLSQDKEYSYEANAETQKEAKKLALEDCYRRSDDPTSCYSHRCEKQEERSYEEDCEETRNYDAYGRRYQRNYNRNYNRYYY